MDVPLPLVLRSDEKNPPLRCDRASPNTCTPA